MEFHHVSHEPMVSFFEDKINYNGIEFDLVERIQGSHKDRQAGRPHVYYRGTNKYVFLDITMVHKDDPKIKPKNFCLGGMVIVLVWRR